MTNETLIKNGVARRPGLTGPLDDRLPAAHAGPAAAADDAAAHGVQVPKASSAANLLTALPVLAADVAGLCLSAAAGAALAHAAAGRPVAAFQWYEVLALLPLTAAYFLDGLYPAAGVHPVIEVRQVARVNAAACLAVSAALALVGAPAAAFLAVATAAIVAVGVVPTCRAAARAWASRRAWWGLPVIVCGSGPNLRRTVAMLKSRPATGFRPVCAVDPCNHGGGLATGVPILRHPRGAARLARRANIRHAVVVLPDWPREAVARLVERYGRSVPNVLVVSSAAGMPTLFQDARACGTGLAGVEVRNRLILGLPRVSKRLMDLALVAVAAPLLGPVMLALALLVKLTSRGPVFFGHTRIGASGTRFTAWKFRTMDPDGARLLREHLAANPAARAEWDRDHKLRDDPRVTPVGRFLRKTSLDELPQLWNVVRGEMSLVGPRPIVRDEVVKYGRQYQQYKQVVPGITGLWQVSGRNDTTYDQRVELDRYYVRNWSPWLDLWILARTVVTIVRREGAY